MLIWKTTGYTAELGHTGIQIYIFILGIHNGPESFKLASGTIVSSPFGATYF